MKSTTHKNPGHFFRELHAKDAVVAALLKGKVYHVERVRADYAAIQLEDNAKALLKGGDEAKALLADLKANAGTYMSRYVEVAGNGMGATLKNGRIHAA